MADRVLELRLALAMRSLVEILFDYNPHAKKYFVQDYGNNTGYSKEFIDAAIEGIAIAQGTEEAE